MESELKDEKIEVIDHGSPTLKKKGAANKDFKINPSEQNDSIK